MSLNFSKFPVTLQGLDTKTDEKQVVPGKLTTLENGRFVSPGKISKRNGLTSLGLTVEGSGSITRGVSLAANDNETLLFDGSNVFSGLASSGKWIARGTARSLQTTTKPIINTTRSQKSPDVAITGSIALYAYEEFETYKSSLRCTVVDTVTGQVLQNNALIDPLGFNPRCVTFANALYVVYGNYSTNNLLARRVDPLAPTVLESPITLATDLIIVAPSGGTGQHIDGITAGSKHEVLALSDRLVVAYGKTTTGVSLKTFVSSSLTSLGSVNVNSIVQMFSPIALWSDPNENIWIAGCSPVTGAIGASPIKASIYTPALATVMTASTVASSSYATIRMGGISTTGSISSLYFEVTDTTDASIRANADLDRNILVSCFGPARAATTASFRRSVALDSVPFGWEGNHYLWTFHDSPLQPTYFLLDADGQVVSKANASQGGRARTNEFPSHVANPASGTFLVANQRAGRLYADSGSLYTLPGVAATTIDFLATTGSFWTAKLGRQLHSVGGIMSSYDGFSFVEHGFHVYPESVSASLNYSGGRVCSGSYLYTALYSWTDAYGQIHRSRPAPLFEVNIPSGSMISGSIDLTVPTLRLTAKENRSPVSIEIYRTEGADGGGFTLYKVTPVTSSLYNSSSIDTVTFRDTLADDAIIFREPIYTNGGILDNDPVPTCRMIDTWKNRLWIGGLEDPQTLQFSKQSTYGEAVTFSDFFTVRMDPQGGIITAIKGMDEQLVVFKERGIHLVYPLTDSGTALGGGPDNTGNGAEFTHRLLASDVGCVNQNSVELTDMGIFFKSAKGIYLLSRDLTLSYVGAPVESFNDLTITSANLVADTNQVRFSTSDGVCLVYDYFAQQWSTYTNHEAVDAVVVAGKFRTLSSDGEVREEEDGTFTDDGAHIPLEIETGWLSFNGISGFQRVSRMFILGEYKGSHQLQVKFAHNYNPTFTQTETIDATGVLTDTADSDYPSYELRVDPQQQLGRAIRVNIADIQTSSFNEGLSLSNLAFEVGAIQGGPRLGPKRQS